MKFLANQEPRNLHFRSTLIGSLLSGIGTAAGIALLVLIAMSVSFGHEHPTDAQIIKEVATASAIYALGAAVTFAVLGLIVHTPVSLLSKGSLKATAVASHVLAGICGAIVGSGFWVWQMMVTMPVQGQVAQFACHMALIGLTGLLTYGAWIALSALLKIRGTEDGKTISHSLARTACVTSLVPWAYFALMIFVNP